MQSSPRENPDHAAKMIGSLACQGEVEGYWLEARKRGLAPHELKMLSQRKRELMKAKAWSRKMEVFR